MGNRRSFKSCSSCRRDSSPHAFRSQECRLSVIHKTQSLSEPSSPIPTTKKDTIDFSRLVRLPEAIDFDSLKPAKREDDLTDSEHWRKSSSGTYKFPDRAYNELKEYEQSFDKSRRWKNPTASFSLSGRDVGQGLKSMNHNH
jgi:hypothetical protein